MKVTIKFDPDDESYKNMLYADELFQVIDYMLGYMRDLVKYNDHLMTQEEFDRVEKIRDELVGTIDHHGLNKLFN